MASDWVYLRVSAELIQGRKRFEIVEHAGDLGSPGVVALREDADITDAVRELVAAGERLHSAAWDAHYGKGLSADYARAVDREWKDALAKLREGGSAP